MIYYEHTKAYPCEVTEMSVSSVRPFVFVLQSFLLC